MQSLALALTLLGLSSAAQSTVTARFTPNYLRPMKKGAQEAVALVLRTDKASDGLTAIKLKVPRGAAVTPKSREVKLQPGRSVPVFFRVRLDAPQPMGSTVSTIVEGREAAKSAVVLKQDSHPFTIKLADIDIGQVIRQDGSRVDVIDNTFEVIPGNYKLSW